MPAARAVRRQRHATRRPSRWRVIEAALQANDKDYEFHTYDDAGHAFFTVDRPNYNVAAALDGWQKVFDFFGRHLS